MSSPTPTLRYRHVLLDLSEAFDEAEALLSLWSLRVIKTVNTVFNKANWPCELTDPGGGEGGGNRVKRVTWLLLPRIPTTASQSGYFLAMA